MRVLRQKERHAPVCSALPKAQCACQQGGVLQPVAAVATQKWHACAFALAAMHRGQQPVPS